MLCATAFASTDMTTGVGIAGNISEDEENMRHSVQRELLMDYVVNRGREELRHEATGIFTSIVAILVLHEALISKG